MVEKNYYIENNNLSKNLNERYGDEVGLIWHLLKPFLYYYRNCEGHRLRWLAKSAVEGLENRFKVNEAIKIG